MKPNPYFPGAGAAPAYIAGRDEDITYSQGLHLCSKLW